MPARAAAIYITFRINFHSVGPALFIAQGFRPNSTAGVVPLRVQFEDANVLPFGVINEVLVVEAQHIPFGDIEIIGHDEFIPSKSKYSSEVRIWFSWNTYAPRIGQTAIKRVCEVDTSPERLTMMSFGLFNSFP